MTFRAKPINYNYLNLKELWQYEEVKNMQQKCQSMQPITCVISYIVGIPQGKHEFQFCNFHRF